MIYNILFEFVTEFVFDPYSWNQTYRYHMIVKFITLKIFLKFSLFISYFILLILSRLRRLSDGIISLC